MTCRTRTNWIVIFSKQNLKRKRKRIIYIRITSGFKRNAIFLHEVAAVCGFSPRHSYILQTSYRYLWISSTTAPALSCTNVNPLNPHAALKHHFASLKNDLISWNQVVLAQKFSCDCFENNSIFFHLSPTSSHLHPLQVENCDSNFAACSWWRWQW